MSGDKVLEKDIEGYLRDECRSRGMDIHKNISDPRRGGTPGLPDNTVILADMRVAWVEVKRPGTIARYLKKRDAYYKDGDTTGCSKTEIRQFREQMKLDDRGQRVFIVGTFRDVDECVSYMETFYT